MRLLYLLDFSPFSEDANGLSKIFYNLIANLPEGIFYDILVVREEKTEENIAQFFEAENVHNLYIKKSKIQSWINKMCFFPEKTLSKSRVNYLFKKYDFSKYDIIHCSHLSFLHLTKLHSKVIIGVNDSPSLSLPQISSRKTEIKRLHAKKQEEKISQSGAWLTLVSERDASAFKTERKIVLANGVNTEKYTPHRKFGERIPKTCVFHGVLDFEPNTKAIQYMSSFLTSNLPDYKLHLVGRFTRDNSSPIVALYNNLPNCVLIGEVDDIAAEISKYQFYLTLLDRGSGIKNKVLEALSCSCVVLANDKALNGIEPARELSKVVYRIGDSEDLEKVFNDSRNWESKSIAARSYMENYHSWKNFTDTVVSFYQNVLNE